MPNGSPQAIISNKDNLIGAATITTSATAKTTANAGIPIPTTRTGRGVITVTGDHAGARKQIDAEITASAGTTNKVTAGVYAGAGNGVISGISVAGSVAAQKYTLTLKSLGTDPQLATLPLWHGKLSAIVAGAAGNDLTITVDPSNTGGSIGAIAVGASQYTTASEISRDTQRLVGAEYDYGGLPLNAAGELLPTSARVKFGDAVQIVSQYRAVENGQDVYYFGAPLASTVPANTPVYHVTGGYAVTITDGVTPVTYTDIVTRYDFLQAIIGSIAVLFDGVVTEDRTPGGLAVSEFDLRTASYLSSIELAGSDYVTGLDDVTVAAGAPTEGVTIRCTDNAVQGGERWTVSGTRSGALGTAKTGVAFGSTVLDFTVPRKAPPSGGAHTGTIYASGANFADPAPHLCDLNFPLLGSSAVNKTLTLTWHPIVENDCCDSESNIGQPSAACLGLEFLEVTGVTVEPAYSLRLAQLNKQFADWSATDALLASGSGIASDYGRQLINPLYSSLYSALNTIYTVTGAALGASVAARADSTAYLVNDKINVSDKIYYCSVAGTSDSSAPTFNNTDLGDTTTDDGVTWVYMGPAPEVEWDDWLANMQTEFLDELTGQARLIEERVKTWSATTTGFSVGTLRRPTSSNSHIYVVEQLLSGSSSATGGSEPTWPTDGSLVVDDAVVWRDMGTATADSNLDFMVATVGLATLIDAFTSRFNDRAKEIMSYAGLDPANIVDAAGGECWQRPTDADGYFAVSGSDGVAYLPLYRASGKFVYYHSVVSGTNERGEQSVISTKEFGFGLLICSNGSLTEGDTITLVISGVAHNNTYQLDDSIKVNIINAGPLEFTGGVDGDNAHVWAVNGAVAGQLADYTVVNDAELPYSNAASGGAAEDVDFTVYRGSRAGGINDTIIFYVERAQFRWRVDGGAWSSAVDVPASPFNVPGFDGLSLVFTSAAGQSWVSGDVFSFDCIQRYAADNLLAPGHNTHQWDGAANTITITWGGDQAIEFIALPVLNLPDGAAVTVAALDAGDVELDSWALTLGDTAAVIRVDDAITTIRKITVAVTSASGGALGWIFAGSAWRPEYGADDSFISPAWSMAGNTAAAQSLQGAGYVGEFSWGDTLKLSELQALYSVISYSKQNNNQAVVAVADVIADPIDIAALVRINADQVQSHNWRGGRESNRAGFPHSNTAAGQSYKDGFAVRVPFSPVYM